MASMDSNVAVVTRSGLGSDEERDDETTPDAQRRRRPPWPSRWARKAMESPCGHAAAAAASPDTSVSSERLRRPRRPAGAGPMSRRRTVCTGAAGASVPRRNAWPRHATRITSAETRLPVGSSCTYAVTGVRR